VDPIAPSANTSLSTTALLARRGWLTDGECEMAVGHLSRTKKGEIEATRAPTSPVVSLGLLWRLAVDMWGRRDSPRATRLSHSVAD
jgi:hypothetical protein